MLKLTVRNDGSYVVNEVKCKGKKVESMEWLAKFCASKIRHAGASREHLVAVFMDMEHKMICHGIMFSGDIDGAPIYPAIIAQHAALAGASLVAIAHNHPNGTVLPSIKDMEATAEVKRTLEAVGMHLTNSLVVVGDGAVFNDCVEILASTEAYKNKLISGALKLGAKNP